MPGQIGQPLQSGGLDNGTSIFEITVHQRRSGFAVPSCSAEAVESSPPDASAALVARSRPSSPEVCFLKGWSNSRFPRVTFSAASAARIRTSGSPDHMPAINSGNSLASLDDPRGHLISAGRSTSPIPALQQRQDFFRRMEVQSLSSCPRAAAVASSSQRLLSACEAWPFVQDQVVLCREFCSSSSCHRS